MRAAPVIAVVLALGATACGGGGGTDTRAAKREIDPASQEQAKSMVLRLSDFPTGWRASRPSSDEAGQKTFRKCLGVDYSDVTLRADANSKDFANGESTTASSEIQITADEADASQGFKHLSRAMGGSAVADCVRHAVADAMPAGYDVGDVDFGALSFTRPSGIDEARAWQALVPIDVTSGAAKGMSVSAYIDVVFLRKGRVVASVRDSDVITPFDSDLRDQLIQTQAERIRKG